MAKYRVGASPESFDKQYVRDWLTKMDLRGQEGVELPPEVVEMTGQKYKEAFQMLVGRSYDEERDG